MSGWEGPLREMRRKVAEALQFPYGGPAALDIIDATIATLAAPRPDWQRGYDQGQDDFRDALDRIDAELRANPPRAALSGSTAPLDVERLAEAMRRARQAVAWTPEAIDIATEYDALAAALEAHGEPDFCPHLRRSVQRPDGPHRSRPR